jgi:hypothetical protein
MVEERAHERERLSVRNIMVLAHDFTTTFVLYAFGAKRDKCEVA